MTNWTTTKKKQLYKDGEAVWTWFSEDYADPDDIEYYLREKARDKVDGHIEVSLEEQWKVYEDGALIYADDLGWLV